MDWIQPRQEIEAIQAPKVLAVIELPDSSTRPIGSFTYADTSLFCCYCGKPFSFSLRVTADHLIPSSKGGRNNNYNKRNCCNQCNASKGSLYPEKWLKQIKAKRNRLKCSRNPLAKSLAYDLDIMIENISYIIEYVQSAGVKLFIDKYYYEAYLDRRNT